MLLTLHKHWKQAVCVNYLINESSEEKQCLKTWHNTVIGQQVSFQSVAIFKATLVFKVFKQQYIDTKSLLFKLDSCVLIVHIHKSTGDEDGSVKQSKLDIYIQPCLSLKKNLNQKS